MPECVKCVMPEGSCVCKALEAGGDTICYDCGVYSMRCDCMVTVKCHKCMDGKLMFPEGFLDCWDCDGVGYKEVYKRTV